MEEGRLRHDLAGNILAATASIHSQFFFDASGTRARQMKTRTTLSGALTQEVTLYLGSYERAIHSTAPNNNSPPSEIKRVHRHNLGDLIYTRIITPTTGEQVRLTTKLDDHLGSTDVLITSLWNGSKFEPQSTEYQSYDPWGERANVATATAFRQNDSDPFRRSAQDYDRGYTGHEMLDDSGLIHMNGRLYDAELGRMLSPDPYVQVPEYSQNFNRYSYVLNNPLNKTDPTGYSWVSKVFKGITKFFQKNAWLAAVIGVIAGVFTAGLALNLATLALGIVKGTIAAAALTGAVAGTISGVVSSTLMGMPPKDILKNGIISGLTGASLAALQYVAMEGFYNYLYGDDLKNLDIYQVDNADNAYKEALDLKGMYSKSENIRKISNWQELETYKGDIWINGQSNDYVKAINLGKHYTGSNKFLLLHNPSSKATMMDAFESGLDKLSGATQVSRQAAQVLSKVSPDSTIYSHSQGTIITRNALAMMRDSGRDISRFTIHMDGAAVNKQSTNLFLRYSGSKSLSSFHVHSLDAVPNIVGYNGFTIPNPIRIGGSVISAPLLGIGGEWSPHTYRNGGSHLRWFPDYY